MIARLAKESGLFPVFEAVDGEVTAVSPIRRQVAVEEYLRRRGASRICSPARAARTSSPRLQACADRNIERFGLLDDGEERRAARVLAEIERTAGARASGRRQP